jgi:hypothetical protein
MTTTVCTWIYNIGECSRGLHDGAEEALRELLRQGGIPWHYKEVGGGEEDLRQDESLPVDFRPSPP